MKIWGHRGVRGGIAENTLAAFARAEQEGADGVELDVRLCASGQVVVFHDHTLKRMTGGFDSRAISALSWSELLQIDLGNDTRAPLLDEVLEWIGPKSLMLNVELKRDVPSRTGLVTAVAKILRRSKVARERLLLSSFDPLMLAGLRPLLPGVRAGMLFHRGQQKWRPWLWAELGPYSGAHPEHSMIDRVAVERLRKRRRFVNAWTVNDPAEARRLAEIGVDGIITDKPRIIREALQKL